MRRRIIFPLLATVCYMLLVGTALAQATTPTGTAEGSGGNARPGMSPVVNGMFFPWYDPANPDIIGGVLIALGGLVGATVMIWRFLGSPFPGTTNATKFPQAEALVETLEAVVPRYTEERRSAQEIDAASNAANRARDNLEQMNKSSSAASIFYLFLGVCFAVFIGRDLLQALLIGAGWGGVASSIGLNYIFKERIDVKDNAIDKLIEKASALEQNQASVTQFLARPNVRTFFVKSHEEGDPAVLQGFQGLIEQASSPSPTVADVHEAIEEARLARKL